MRVTAYSLLLFYVVLNLSLYLVSGAGNADYQVIPLSILPHETPEALYTRLIGMFLTLGIVTLAGWLFGQVYLGGGVALLLFVIQFFVGSDSIFHWVFWGLPNFISTALGAAGVDLAISAMFVGTVLAMTSVIWFWFIMSLMSGRVLEQ